MLGLVVLLPSVGDALLNQTEVSIPHPRADVDSLIETDLAVHSLRPARRLGSFQTAAPLPPPQPAPAPVPAATPAQVRVPAVGMDLPILRGGQATIDQGHATWFDDGPGGWPDPTAPGSAGTFWLAGHRTSAGGPFASVVDIPIGAIVEIVLTDGRIVTYRITTSFVVSPLDGWTAIYGPDPTEALIALQTSLPHDKRLILRGIAV